MIKRILFATAVLTLSLVAATKQYSLTLSQPVQVGAVKLAPGEYKLKVDGTTATFIDSHKKETSATVKIEKVAKKSQFTAVETKDANGATEVGVIDLAGADFKLVF